MIGIIDDKDKAILELLREHGDYTTRQIARKTLLPPTTINNRIRKLKQDGVIRKFTVALDPVAMEQDFKVYVLISADLLTLKEKKKTQYDMVSELRKLPAVESADIVSGGTDIVVTVKVKDRQEYDRLLLGRIQLIDGVERTQSLIVIH